MADVVSIYPYAMPTRTFFTTCFFFFFQTEPTPEGNNETNRTSMWSQNVT